MVGGAAHKIGKTAGRMVGSGAAVGNAVTAYSRGFDKAIAGALRKSGVDVTNAKALKAFAKANPGIAARATQAAEFNKTTGDKLGAIGEEVVSRGIEKGIKAIGKRE
jgi:hypothetical protein